VFIYSADLELNSPNRHVEIVSLHQFIELLYPLGIRLEPTDICELFQAESVRDAAWGCDWVGTPVPFQRCLVFIIATANKEFTLTAGKFVPVSKLTMLNVRVYIRNGMI
jgi:hypothetical protein